MTRSEFEAEVSDFCKLYLCDYIEDYHVDYNTYDDDDDIEACVSIECAGNRNYALTLIVHPYREGDIAIRTYESDWVKADSGGLYLWLWNETLNGENAMMRDAGLMRMGDGSVTAKYYVEDGRHVYIGLKDWHEKRKQVARRLAGEA